MADPVAPLPPMIPVANETRNSKSRIAQNGKYYTYKIEVLQQPERARACGSGVKSSADRRPVDPPPIVQLRVFEGSPENGEQTDVTFSINANYFLFATLDYARPMQDSQVVPPPIKPDNEQVDATTNVLTGSPVAGMVFLDRPRPAGYFIFSDLSVRHEGTYRLCFHLYEMLKDPGDESDSGRMSPVGGPHVKHVLEVKSAPFMTFSAKKFPGLAESTLLSRTLAEQGCRVRIRRDIRIRRTEPAKHAGKDWSRHPSGDHSAKAPGDYDTAAGPGMNHCRLPTTPTSSGFPSLPVQLPLLSGGDILPRPRSSSTSSRLSLGLSLGPVPSLSRRTSLCDINQPINPPWGSQQAKSGTGQYQSSPSLQYASGPFGGQQHPSAASMQPPAGPYNHSYQPHQQLPPPLPQPHQSHQGNYSSYPPTGSSPHPFSTSFAPPPPQPPPSYGNSAGNDSRRSSYTLSLPLPQPPLSSPSAGYGQPNMGNHTYSGAVSLPPPGPPTQSYQHHVPPPPPLAPTQQTHNNSYAPVDNYNLRPAPAEPPIGQPPASRPQLEKLPSITHLSNTGNSRPNEYSVSPHATAYPSIEVPPSQPPPQQAPNQNVNPLKRSYETTFPEQVQHQHMTQLRNGTRPASPPPPPHPHQHSHHTQYVPDPSVNYQQPQQHQAAEEPAYHHHHQATGYPEMYPHHQPPPQGAGGAQVQVQPRPDEQKYQLPNLNGHAAGAVPNGTGMIPVHASLGDVPSIPGAEEYEYLNYKRSNGNRVSRPLPPYA